MKTSEAWLFKITFVHVWLNAQRPPDMFYYFVTHTDDVDEAWKEAWAYANEILANPPTSEISLRSLEILNRCDVKN